MVVSVREFTLALYNFGITTKRVTLKLVWEGGGLKNAILFLPTYEKNLAVRRNGKRICSGVTCPEEYKCNVNLKMCIAP